MKRVSMAENAESACGEMKGGRGLECTRERDHHGDHVAHDTEGRELLRWPREEQEK